MACHPRATCHIAECCHLANSMSWSQSYRPMSHCRVLLPGEFSGMLSQNHVITLQSATTWWIHCHDSRATCHIAGCSHLAKSMSWYCHIAGCNNSIRYIETRFSPYFIFFWFLKMQFGLWLAAAFVSSPIHLLTYHFNFLIIKTGVLVVIFLVLCCGRGQVS